jgi:hypothetical protein
MSETTSEPRTPVDWRKLHAFGWPAGSVRALMALIVFGALWVFLVRSPDQEVPEYLKDILFIILGHYFAVRSQSRSLSMGRDGADEELGPPPLYLPRGSVRLLLVAGFGVTAFLLYRQGRLLAIGQNPAVVTLLLTFGFILGVVLRQVVAQLTGRDRRLPRLVEDVRALLSLAAAVFLVVVLWDRFLPGSPGWGLEGMNLGLGRIGPPHVAAAIVGFYFGSRS